MAQVRRKSKELDHYLKSVINKVPNKINSFIDEARVGDRMIYYTGNWSTDVSNNFTDKQSEKYLKLWPRLLIKEKHNLYKRKESPLK